MEGRGWRRRWLELSRRSLGSIDESCYLRFMGVNIAQASMTEELPEAISKVLYAGKAFLRMWANSEVSASCFCIHRCLHAITKALLAAAVLFFLTRVLCCGGCGLVSLRPHRQQLQARQAG